MFKSRKYVILFIGIMVFLVYIFHIVNYVASNVQFQDWTEDMIVFSDEEEDEEMEEGDAMYEGEEEYDYEYYASSNSDEPAPFGTPVWVIGIGIVYGIRELIKDLKRKYDGGEPNIQS